MKRSYPLRVDRLEDRCVPAADPLADASSILVEPPSPEPTEVVVAPEEAQFNTPVEDGTSYVIDPYLIDPNDPASQPKTVDPSDSGWTEPDQSLVPPIGDPFWAVSTEPDSTIPGGDTSFVIDPYLIDPNDPASAPKTVDGGDSGWTEPDQSLVPPIDDPFWAVSTEPDAAPSTDDTSFVIDPYLIDPNDPGAAPKSVDGSDSGWAEPDQSVVPPIGDPFWAV